jgi:hypothetical protein
MSNSSSSCSEIKNQAQKVIVTFVLQKKRCKTERCYMAMIAIHALEQKTKSRYLLFLKKKISAENLQNILVITL